MIEFFSYLLQHFLKPYIISKLIHKLEINSLNDFTNYSTFIKKIIPNDVKYSFYGSSENLSLYHDKIIFNPIDSIPFHLEISRKTFTKLKKPLQGITDILYNLKPDPKQKQNILLVNFDVVEFEELLLHLNVFNVNTLYIYNRYGTLVYKSNNYNNDWEGQSNDGKKLPVGTYFYHMIHDDNLNKTGWVYLNY